MNITSIVRVNKAMLFYTNYNNYFTLSNNGNIFEI